MNERKERHGVWVCLFRGRRGTMENHTNGIDDDDDDDDGWVEVGSWKEG